MLLNCTNSFCLLNLILPGAHTLCSHASNNPMDLLLMIQWKAILESQEVWHFFSMFNGIYNWSQVQLAWINIIAMQKQPDPLALDYDTSNFWVGRRERADWQISVAVQVDRLVCREFHAGFSLKAITATFEFCLGMQDLVWMTWNYFLRLNILL